MRFKGTQQRVSTLQSRDLTTAPPCSFSTVLVFHSHAPSTCPAPSKTEVLQCLPFPDHPKPFIIIPKKPPPTCAVVLLIVHSRLRKASFSATSATKFRPRAARKHNFPIVRTRSARQVSRFRCPPNSLSHPVFLQNTIFKLSLSLPF